MSEPLVPPKVWEEIGFLRDGHIIIDPAGQYGEPIYGWPRLSGFNVSATIENTPRELAELFYGKRTKKEVTTMTQIDRKKFETATVPQQARWLAAHHVGSLVTVTTVDGAEITDILTGIATGAVGGFERRHQGLIYVQLANTHKHRDYGGDQGGFHLEPTSKVKIRFPHEDA